MSSVSFPNSTSSLFRTNPGVQRSESKNLTIQNIGNLFTSIIVFSEESSVFTGACNSSRTSLLDEFQNLVNSGNFDHPIVIDMLGHIAKNDSVFKSYFSPDNASLQAPFIRMAKALEQYLNSSPVSTSQEITIRISEDSTENKRLAFIVQQFQVGYRSALENAMNNRPRLFLLSESMNPEVRSSSYNWNAKDSRINSLNDLYRIISFNDKAYVLKRIETDYKYFGHVSDTLKNDKECALSALRKCFRAIGYVGDTLKNDKEFWLTAVKIDGRCRMFLSSNLLDDKDIALAALNSTRMAYIYTSLRPNLENDPDIMAWKSTHIPGNSQPATISVVDGEEMISL